MTFNWITDAMLHAVCQTPWFIRYGYLSLPLNSALVNSIIILKLFSVENGGNQFLFTHTLGITVKKMQ